MKSLLALCVVAALLVAAVAGESAVDSLKAKVNAGEGAAPCDKAAPAAGPAPPRQFLDIRLPVVVDDYHAPVGGFNPSHIPDKEVDVAARKILREIQAAEAEAKANGDAPVKETQDGILTTEEHKALKQLLLDSDILVRAAAKALAENGPIEAAAVKKVAASAVAKAAGLEKKSSKPIAKLDKKAKKAAEKKVGSAGKPAVAAGKPATAAGKAAVAKPAAPAAAKPAAPAAAAPAAAKPAAPAAAAPAAAAPAAAAAKPAAAVPKVGAAAPAKVANQNKSAAVAKQSEKAAAKRS